MFRSKDSLASQQSVKKTKGPGVDQCGCDARTESGNLIYILIRKGRLAVVVPKRREEDRWEQALDDSLVASLRDKLGPKPYSLSSFLRLFSPRRSQITE